jgi:hypothetical protein
MQSKSAIDHVNQLAHRLAAKAKDDARKQITKNFWWIITNHHRQILRHPELVSGSIPPHAPPLHKARWMLKQVQHDV